MGRLAKAHLARLITLTAAWYQLAAAVQGFIWPKILWDFLTDSLDIFIAPIPILQLVNLFCAALALGLEWPFYPLAGSYLHESVQFHIVVCIINLFPAVFLYQGTNAALYHAVGAAIYTWGYYDGEKKIGPIWKNKSSAPNNIGLNRGVPLV
ncbi:hypothetical protein F5X97DRAFT_317514 [Nemania serpens]|nr:hypothetical protein F5X97DRAFT_317514 [Nemania serpens]